MLLAAATGDVAKTMSAWTASPHTATEEETCHHVALRRCLRDIRISGADTWAIAKRQDRRIDMTEMRMLRWMCGVRPKTRSGTNTYD